MKKTLAILFVLMMAVCLLPTIAFAEGETITVVSTGAKYDTLAAAVAEAQSGDTIVLTSNLTMTESARFWDKHLTITSGEGGPYTITRGEIATVSDKARGSYNPAMIEVQTSGSSASLTLTNIILDDAFKHKGTVFAQAISGKSEGDESNKVYVQDAMIASNATVPCTITLGEGAVLRNFGGMSAVRVTDQAKLVMESGSVIEDYPVTDRVKGNSGSVGPAGAVWMQGGSFNMEKDAKIENINGRAVYVDGGNVTVGGTISNITGNANMWQGKDGTAIHLRNSDANATLTSAAVIENISGGDSAIYVTGSGNKITTEQQAVIKNLTNTHGIYLVNSAEAQLRGDITNLTGSNALSINDGAHAVLEAEGSICNNKCATAVVYLRGGALFTIKGKINNNTSSGNCAALFIVTNGDSSHATLEKGGEICNNTNSGSKYGAAVELQQGDCSFTMNGGKITGNKGPLGAIQVHKAKPKFIMNGGEITGNTTTGTIDAGVYLSDSASPTAELNGGVLQSVVVDNEVNSKTENGHVFIKNGFNLVADHVNMLEGPKTITPADDSFNIKFGNASTESVNALTNASTAKGWIDPLATFWTQRDNAATMTVGGITITDLSMPVYALVQATDANGKPDSNAEVKVYATKVEENSVTFTIPGTGNNGCAVALVQPTGDFGNVVITGPAEIEQNPSATTYEIPYRATYTMSQNFKTMLAQLNLNPDGATSAINLRFVVELDNRLTAKKDEAIDKFIYTFDGAGVLEPIDNAIVVSADGHTITVPCTLEEGWQTAIGAEKIVMTLDGTGVLQAGDFIPGGVLGTTGNIQAFLPIQQGINVLIPANVCKTKMVGEEQKMYIVTYTDGVEGTTVFEDQTYEIKSGDFTPAFRGTPSRSGYTFTGWSPAVAPTVTDHVTYTAQWSENGGSHTHPDPKPVPVVTLPPKTGDMTLWQSILHFFGIR